MQFKEGVNSEGVAREMWYALGFLDALYKLLAHNEATVTSLTDGSHHVGSLHLLGRAADIRTRDFGERVKQLIYIEAKWELGPMGFDVLLEDDHLHVEWHPKEGKTLWRA